MTTEADPLADLVRALEPRIEAVVRRVLGRDTQISAVEGDPPPEPPPEPAPDPAPVAEAPAPVDPKVADLLAQLKLDDTPQNVATVAGWVEANYGTPAASEPAAPAE